MSDITSVDKLSLTAFNGSLLNLTGTNVKNVLGIRLRKHLLFPTIWAILQITSLAKCEKPPNFWSESPGAFSWNNRIWSDKIKDIQFGTDHFISRVSSIIQSFNTLWICFLYSNIQACYHLLCLFSNIVGSNGRYAFSLPDNYADYKKIWHLVRTSLNSISVSSSKCHVSYLFFDNRNFPIKKDEDRTI